MDNGDKYSFNTVCGHDHMADGEIFAKI